MADFLATIDGHRLTALTVHVPWSGVWCADADLADQVELSGRVEIKLGSLTLSGTVMPEASGSFGLATKVRVVAGAGGWQRLVPAKHYHSDAGVRTALVLEDTARIVGERLGTMRPPRERVGADYARSAGPASRVLEQLVGGAWWLDYAGVTHVGPRPPATASGYELLEYDPRDRVATLSVDDPATIGSGATITGAALPEPATVRELEVILDGEKLRILAWCGDAAGTGDRIAQALRAVTRAEAARRVHGLWRYRLVAMAAERVELQAVSKAAGLPDMLPLHMRPGIAGAWAELTPGSMVLVQFIEGDPTMPVVTHFEEKSGDGWKPAVLELDADKVTICGGTNGVARRLDSVVAGPFGGQITGGSTKVLAG